MAGKAILPPLPTVAHILKLYNVKARKHLAQNFLFDPRITDRIVSYAGSNLTGRDICEIGPGPGGITRSLLRRGAESISVVEKDARFIPSLQMLADASQGRIKVHHADILNFDHRVAFSEDKAQPWTESKLPELCLVGNLPFNVSLPLLFKYLDDISHRRGIFELGRIPSVLTFQYEVAERLMSLPGDRQRCRLSVTAQYLCEVRYGFTILGSSFVPAPKVNVGVVKLVPKKEFDIQLPFKTVDHVVKHIFHLRQAYCKKGIQSLFPPKRDDLVWKMLKVTGINPKLPPYKLYMSHFRDLCYTFVEMCEAIPQLKLVDTYNVNEWKRYFDDSGEPVTDDVSPIHSTLQDESSAYDEANIER